MPPRETLICKFGDCTEAIFSDDSKHDVYKNLDEHVNHNHNDKTRSKDAPRLHWICQQSNFGSPCNYQTVVKGGSNHGIVLYRTHARTWHGNERLAPSHRMLEKGELLSMVSAFKRDDSARREKAKKAKRERPRPTVAIAEASASSSRPQPHGQPQGRLHAHPQAHQQAHPTRALQPQPHQPPQLRAAQVTPDSMHASGNTYPLHLLATDIQGGPHQCELAACGKRYKSVDNAKRCSDWHRETGYLANEYPPGYSLAQKGAPLVHNAEWPLYHEIKGPGDLGNFTCTYPRCGRRYTRYNSAYLCMRWHQHTRRQVKEIVGHYPDAPLPALLIDTPKASRGVAGYYACDHKMVACDRAYMSHLFAQWCQDWHQATNERYPNTPEDWTRLRNRGQLPPNY